jgi:serine/threonine protein kinase
MPTLALMPGGRIPVSVRDVAEVELVELLGMGGYGSAWKARDVSTGRLYVLKIITGLIPGSVEAERVRLEAEVSVPSEHVVPAVGLREWDPSTFLILFKHFPGQSLDKLLESGRLDTAQKKRVFLETLIGVSDAHRNNIIHRDLKPGNVLVQDDGHARIFDFGISKFKGSGLTVSGAIIGTIPYMAPEIIMGGAKSADARADVFSLGQILYELSMGQHFWTRRGWVELSDLVSYLTRDPPPTEAIDLSDFRCGMFRDAAPVLERMVKIDPSERYDSVDDILSDLGYIPSLPEPPEDLHLRSPLLIVESGSNRGARTVLHVGDGGQIILGREDIAGSDTSISRRSSGGHLEFSRRGEKYFVRSVSGKEIMVRAIVLDKSDPPIEVRHADRIKVGDVFLRFAFLRRL